MGQEEDESKLRRQSQQDKKNVFKVNGYESNAEEYQTMP
jgi:hypothetical protein